MNFTEMAPRISRRAFLAGLGGSVASVSLAFGLWKYGPWVRMTEARPAMTVDYSGWIVTPADKARLIASGNIRLIEDAVFPGYGMSAKPTESVNDCSSWCLQEPDCLGFSWAKPDHPNPGLRKRCLLKDDSPLTPTPDPHFTSGVR